MKMVAKHSLIIALYAVLTLVMTWPVAATLNTEIAGSGGDPWQTLWRFSEKSTLLQDAVTSSETSEFVRQEFFGGRESTLVNLSVWPWMPLLTLFSVTATYNLVWLGTFLLAGYGMFLLVSFLAAKYREDLPAKTRVAGAFVAGLMYMFAPYHVAHSLGHFGAMQTQWFPFVILLVLSSFIQVRWWKTILLSALLVFQGWSEHHYFLWLIFFGIFAALYFRASWQTHRSAWLHSVGAIALAGVILVASYLPTIRLALESGSSLVLGEDQTVRFSADLFAFVIPAAFHTFWGRITDSLFTEYFTGNVVEATQFVGLLPLLLILFFHQRLRQKDLLFWGAAALGFLVISLGPKLHVFGVVTSIPLPWAAVDSLPIFSSVRAVARAGAFVTFSVAVLFGLTLTTQLRRIGGAYIVAAIVLLEFLFFPFPTQSTELSAVYDVAKNLGGSAILEIPAGTNYVTASKALFAEQVHDKQTLGNIALERAQDSDDFDLVKSLPAVRQLLYLRTTDLRENRPEFFAQDLAETMPDVLRYVDVGGIIVHPDSLSLLQSSATERFLEERVGLSPEVIDDSILYNTEQLAGGDGVFLMRGEGWSNIGFDAKRNSVFGEITENAYATIVNTTNEIQRRTIEFTIPEEGRSEGRIYVGGQEATRFSAEDSFVSVIVELKPQENELRIESADQQTLIIQNPRLFTTPL